MSVFSPPAVQLKTPTERITWLTNWLTSSETSSRRSRGMSCRACWRMAAWSRCAPRCARRTSTTRKSRRSRGRRFLRISIRPYGTVDRSTVRSNDLHFPKMGAAGRRFGRNFALEHTFPDTAEAPDSQSARRQQGTDDPRHVQARDDFESRSRAPGCSSWCTTGSCTRDRRPSSSKSPRLPATTTASRACACREACPTRRQRDRNVRPPTPT